MLSSIPNPQNVHFLIGTILLSPDLGPPHSTLNTVLNALVLAQVPKETAFGPYRTSPDRLYIETLLGTVREREEERRI